MSVPGNHMDNYRDFRMDIESGYTQDEIIKANPHPHALETLRSSAQIWKIRLHSSHFLLPFFEKKMARVENIPQDYCCLVTLVRSWPPSGKESWFWENNPGHSCSILMNWIENLVSPFSIPLKIFVQNPNAVPPIQEYLISILNDEKHKNLDVTVEFTGDLRGYHRPQGRQAMNRFLGYDMYWHPSLERYTFIWRLDSDAFFIDAPMSNPLEQMTDDFDIGFSMLGMPEVFAPFNPLYLTDFQNWFLQRGNLCHFSLNGDFSVRDTILAGPFELYRLSCFRNATYTSFWMDNDIDGMIDGKYGYSQADNCREQFIKTIWIRASIAPMRINYFGELSMYHQCVFRNRCTMQWKTTV